ncbi:MAG: DUF2314 domain-containing protein [Anaerolineales bacterium]
MRRLSKSRQLILPGGLIQEYIAFQFAIFYLPTPSADPLVTLSQFLNRWFFQFHQVDKVYPATRPQISARVLKDVKKSYTPPDLDSLRYLSRGLDHNQAYALQNSEQALVLDFGCPKEMAWDGLKTASQLIGAIAHETEGLIWDAETRLLFTPDHWDEQRINSWTESVPDLSKNIVVHLYKHGDYVRAVSLGMTKFGLPDIVINHVSWSLGDSMVNLITMFAQILAEGVEIGSSGEFNLEIETIRNSSVRQHQIAHLKPNARAKAELWLQEGNWEPGDPDNRLIEIAFDKYDGSDLHSRQTKMIGDLFGWEESFVHAEHDDELLAASRRARDKLPSLRQTFTAGLKPGEFIQVKAPFQTPDGNDEWMWVEVISWKSDKIRGLLKNEPINVPGLYAGQVVEISENTLFDYLVTFPDGSQAGNETGEILAKYERRE